MKARLLGSFTVLLLAVRSRKERSNPPESHHTFALLFGWHLTRRAQLNEVGSVIAISSTPVHH
jgi:hypothetical protein